MEITNYANICRLCLAEVEHFSEPLSNCVDNVLLVFRLEVFLDDGLPQQICLKCSHTLMITAKLRDTVYETDTLLKTYHKTDIKPDLKNVKLNETADITNNINNAIHSQEYKNEEDESVDIKFNYPNSNDLTTPMDMVVMNSRPIIKSEARVVLKKLPDHISRTSFVYCSICLLAFTDGEQFRHEKHAEKLHDNERQRQNSKDELTLAIEQGKKNVGYQRKHRANMIEEQRKKYLERKRERRANLTGEARKEYLEYHRKYHANLTKEQQKKYKERKRKMRTKLTEEQRKKQKENYRIKSDNMTEEERKKFRERRRKEYAKMTDEQRRKKREYQRKWYNLNLKKHMT